MPEKFLERRSRNRAAIGRAALAAETEADAGAPTLQGLIDCGHVGEALELAIERLCDCLVARLSAPGHHIGVRLPGHVAPPPGALGILSIAGVADGSAVGIATGGAWQQVVAYTPTKNAAGCLTAFGHGVQDSLAWESMSWRVRMGQRVILPSWIGQVATLSAPLYVGPFPFTDGEQLILEASHSLGSTYNVMGVLHGFEFGHRGLRDQPAQALQVDIG